MKRFFLVMAVAALMAAMLVAMAAPAFAKPNPFGNHYCHEFYLSNGFSHRDAAQQCK